MLNNAYSIPMVQFYSDPVTKIKPGRFNLQNNATTNGGDRPSRPVRRASPPLVRRRRKRAGRGSVCDPGQERAWAGAAGGAGWAGAAGEYGE